jgi:hypothetical protein
VLNISQRKVVQNVAIQLPIQQKQYQVMDIVLLVLTDIPKLVKILILTGII